MDRSTVHKLIGSNKLVANEKKFGFNNNITGIPKNGTTQNTINCNFGLPNCCNQESLSILDACYEKSTGIVLTW